MRYIILKLALVLVCLMLIVIGITLRIGATMEEQIISVVSRYDDGFWRLRKFAVDRQLIVPRFPELRFVQLPYLSPDERYVAWTVSGEIEIRDLLTEESCRLTTGTFLSWSPDGQYFAFRDGDQYYVYDFVRQGCSGQSVLISPQLSVDYSINGVVWSPDSDTVLFEALVDDPSAEIDDYDIYRNSINGDELINLTADWLGDDINPQWSPDGRQILYSRFDSNDDADIYMMDSDGTNQRRITQTMLANVTSSLYWSPDGEMIAFTINGGLHVFVIESGLLIGPIDLNWLPEEIVWLDDNQRILFRSGRTSDLYLVNRDGRFLHRLTNDDHSNVIMP